MEKISAWKVFKYTMAISAGVRFGKRIVMAADAVLLAWLKNRYPDKCETEEKTEE